MRQSYLWNPQQGKPKFGSGYRLNPNCSLTQGLAGLWLFNERCYGCVNTVNGKVIAAQSITSLVPNGVYLNWTNANISTEMIPIVGAFTMYANVYNVSGKPSLGNYGDYLGIYANIGGNSGFYDGSTWNEIASSTISDNTLASFHITYDKAYLRYYRDGVSAATPVAVTTAPRAGNRNFFINKDGTSGAQCAAYYYIVAVYNRALSAAEVLLQSKFPFGTPANPLLLFPSTKRYFVPSGGVTPSFKPYWVPRRQKTIGGGIYVS
jgi:hypothetical protein